MVTLVHGCEKHFVTFVLLNDADLVTIHEVRESVLCLVRDWCNRCSLHDDLVEMCVI